MNNVAKHLIYRLDPVKKMTYENIRAKDFSDLGDMLTSEFGFEDEYTNEPTNTNVYYTIFKCVDGDRNKPISTQYLYFDLDGIDIKQKENYVLCLGGFLEIDPDNIGVVFSGNGLQCFIKLDQEI